MKPATARPAATVTVESKGKGEAMAEATVEDFPEVEVTDPPVVSPEEPARVEFEEVDPLPDKPVTDVKIRLADGTEFRERLERVPIAAKVDWEEPGFMFSISNALLTAEGSVARDGAGSYRIVPPDVRHEVRFDGEALGRMSDEEVRAELMRAREVAAAKAADFFRGMDRGAQLFGDRLDR